MADTCVDHYRLHCYIIEGGHMNTAATISSIVHHLNDTIIANSWFSNRHVLFLSALFNNFVFDFINFIVYICERNLMLKKQAYLNEKTTFTFIGFH